MKISNRVKGILSVIGGFSIYFIFGTVYSWSATNAYYISYLINTGKIDVEIKNGFFFMPTIWIAQYLMMAPALKLSEYITVRGSVILSTIFLASSFLLLLFIFNFIIVILSMILFGLGIGLGFLVIVKNVWRYFPQNAGIANGIILSGVGVSSAILSPLADLMINPDKIKPDLNGVYPDIVSDNIPMFFKTVLIIYVCLGVLGIGLTLPYKKEPKLSANPLIEENDDEDENDNKELLNEKNEPLNSNYKQALLSIKALQLSVFCFCVPFFAMLLPNIARTYGNLNNLDQFALQIMTFTFSIINAVLRFPWGYLYDKIGFKTVMYIIITVQLIVTLSIHFVSFSIYWYFIENMLIAVALSGIFVVIPPTYKQIFGPKNGTDIYGLYSILVGVASVVGVILTQFILKGNNLNDYLIIFMCSAVILFIGLINLIFFKAEPFVYSTTVLDDNKNNNNSERLIPDQRWTTTSQNSN